MKQTYAYLRPGGDLCHICTLLVNKTVERVMKAHGWTSRGRIALMVGTPGVINCARCGHAIEKAQMSDGYVWRHVGATSMDCVVPCRCTRPEPVRPKRKR